ncbi:hypothetical protein FRC07_015019 [Ceratobasidium sp. 392]|nr:hypothetical protein FRC07_015019 [Ceratobasidium sp. 392]
MATMRHHYSSHPLELTSEKKNYDQIFRAWDQDGTGFISGQIGFEIFGQSGLPREDLAKIWTLADVDNCGKLNLAEFHTAMGLIYRRLNGNDIPDVFPPELVPAPAPNLDDQVASLKVILKDDMNASATSSSPASRAPQYSFHESTTAKGGTKEERETRLKVQTQVRLQERMRTLGLTAGTTPVEKGLAAELNEAEETAKKAGRMLKMPRPGVSPKHMLASTPAFDEDTAEFDGFRFSFASTPTTLSQSSSRHSARRPPRPSTSDADEPLPSTTVSGTSPPGLVLYRTPEDLSNVPGYFDCSTAAKSSARELEAMFKPESEQLEPEPRDSNTVIGEPAEPEPIVPELPEDGEREVRLEEVGSESTKAPAPTLPAPTPPAWRADT